MGIRKNKKKKKIRSQQDSNTCETASYAIREISGSRDTADPIATLTAATTNPMATVEPPPPLLVPDCSPYHQSGIHGAVPTLSLRLRHYELLRPGLCLLRGGWRNTNGP